MIHLLSLVEERCGLVNKERNEARFIPAHVSLAYDKK
jgi:hypothetical protein